MQMHRLVGAHLLHYFLKAGAPKVYCIVRAAHAEAAYQRVQAALKRLNLWRPNFAGRISAVAGELSEPDFGLPATQYEELLTSVGEVIHAAGTRYWLGENSQVAANVAGTVNMVTFARKGGASIHYISTAWLDVYEEGDEKDKAMMSSIAYVNIKRKGEELVQFASRFYHVPCAIYRLPTFSVSSKGGFDGDLVSMVVLIVHIPTSQSMHLRI